MAPSTFVVVMMFALVAGSALAQSPRAAPTVSPHHFTSRHSNPRYNSTIKSSYRLSISIAHRGAHRCFFTSSSRISCLSTLRLPLLAVNSLPPISAPIFSVNEAIKE